jgi:flagellar biosynthesis anti-sigma factor FlgM
MPPGPCLIINRACIERNQTKSICLTRSLATRPSQTVTIALGAKEAWQLADETDVKEKSSREGLYLQVLCRLQSQKAIGRIQREKETTIGQNHDSAKVDISKQSWDLQRIAELARKGYELRAKRIKQIKESIVKGEYEVDAQEVARSIIRIEVSRHRKK